MKDALLLSRHDIKIFCQSNDYLVSENKIARWIDQKCTADVVTVVADCVINYIEDELNHNISQEFTSLDIWRSKYAQINISYIFKKPDIIRKSAKNEYDKFFQQPLELLAFANILIKFKRKNKNFYKINNFELLRYIAMREKNALVFLIVYIETVLAQNGLLSIFNDFFVQPSRESYNAVKIAFKDFMISNTRINETCECYRIFIKVINPLAYDRNSLGTEKGRVSNKKISYDMLMYNRDNFRDIYAEKPKDVTRSEYLSQNNIIPDNNYYKYQSEKAKRFLRTFNDKFRDGLSEYPQDNHNNDQATHIHHIFPRSIYPNISYYLENLIALTPTQHLNYAHPNNRTNEINENFQYLLLLAKTQIIKENIISGGDCKIYDFDKLVTILDTGFNNDIGYAVESMDFNAIFAIINCYYNAKTILAN